MDYRRILAICSVLAFAAALPALAGPVEDAQALRGKDPAKAYALIKPLADQGNADAQMLLGYMYNSSEVPGQDANRAFDQALPWFAKAAEQGSPEYQADLGGLLYLGDVGRPSDPAKAAYWFEKAADQGEPRAQYFLGRLLDRGEGVPKNPAAAARWYQKALDQGFHGAAENLASLYANGRGVVQDDIAAFKLYEIAAKEGSGTAAASLGQCYAAGRGVAQDMVSAYAWIVVAVPLTTNARGDLIKERNRFAAKLTLQQMSEGQSRALELFRPHDGFRALAEAEEALVGENYVQRANAGASFRDGEYLPQNFQRAFAAFQWLSDRGDPTGMIALAWMYALGLGVEPDPVEAYVLFYAAGKRAALDSDKTAAADGRHELESQMSPDLLAYARKQAEKWTPKQL
jgi:TPR repeat protein